MISYGENSIIGRDVSIIDVPLVNEIGYDYDDMKGVVDDWNNPYDQTEPIEVYIPPKLKSVIGALGGECKACTSTTLLQVRRKRDLQNSKNSKHLKELVEEMIKVGNDPSGEFCVICHNCIMYLKKISNIRKSSGLSEFSIDDLENVFKK